MPKVSVIIPTYNRAKYITRAIDSVLAQTYKDWELIIIDDGSTDNTKDVVAPYLKDKRIKYIWQENRGVSAARNKGLNMTKGAFVAFLDSDDFYLPEKLERALRVFEEHSDVLICFDSPLIVNKEALKNKSFSEVLDFLSNIHCFSWDTGMCGHINWKQVLESLAIGRLRLMFVPVIRASIKDIKFRENIWAGEDWLYLCEIAVESKCAFYIIKEHLSVITRGGLSQTGTGNQREKYLLALSKTSKIMGSEILFEDFCNKKILSFCYLRLARDCLSFSGISDEFRKRFYISSLFNSFITYPFNIYIYKHIVGDLVLKRWLKK